MDLSRVKLSNLKYMNVMINDVCCVSLVDSGAEIWVVSDAIAEKLDVETCGHNIRGIFGDPIRVNLKMCGDTDCENVADGIPILCAMAPR